jgi:hypothetical protein
MSAETTAIVLAATTSKTVIMAGLRGPAGGPGPPGSGSGVSYMHDHPPSNPLDQQTWYNPLTLQLKVAEGGAWHPVSPDGGHF